VDHHDPLFAGYSLHRSSDQFGESGEPIKLLVPTPLHEQIQARQEFARKAREDRALLAAAPPPAASIIQKAAKSHAPAAPQVAAERSRIAQEILRVSHKPGKRHPVYNPYEPLRLLERRESTPDTEVHKRDEALYRRLSRKGWLRDIALPRGVDRSLDCLAADQPSFREVIAFVHGHLTLARRTGRAPRIPPMLLYGEAGVGKTHFAHSLAQALGTTWRRHSFDNAETASALLGSDRHWANTRYGLLFDLLALGEHANPVVVLDELDKSAGRDTRYDPVAPLHTLLEPETAAHVRDLSLDFELDASLVTWIGTANDPTRLPLPILSRLRLFHIGPARGEDAIQMAQGVINATLKKLLPRSEPVTRRISVDLAHLTPRELFQATEDAASRAAAAGRRHLLLSDFPAWARGVPDAQADQRLH
jgi:ATP-dependent Lon protease